MSDKIFFAYESSSKSGTSINVDAIKAFQSMTTEMVTTWENLKNNGRILIKSIFEAIDACDIFACDLTFFNPNVLFELGYAIAKEKRLMLLINPQYENASSQYSKIDILSNVGYTSFHNGNEISEALSKVPVEPMLLNDLQISNIQNSKDIFYIKSSLNSQTDIDTVLWLQESGYSLIIDDPDEVDYRPFKWYMESIRQASCVIVHISDDNFESSVESNMKASLFAGVSCGLGKETILLAPQNYNPPIDYTDILMKYSGSQECLSKLKNQLKRIENLFVTSQVKKREYDLLRLGVGAEIAENEKENLDKYFVETHSYDIGMRDPRAFFVGRKGTGKTALYYIISERLKMKENTFVISLKPESMELTQNVETTRLYSSIATKASFFNSIWKFVIYSKLLLNIFYDLEIKTKIYDESEEAIITFCEKHKEILKKHFIEMVKYYHDNYTENNALENFHIQYINVAQKLIKEYLRAHKYVEIVIMADNLDKTWDVQHDISVQTEMVLSLFEVTGMIENELKHEKSKIKTRVILFLREDIFNHILKYAREPDKLTLYKHNIDWKDFPDKLKQLLEERFRFSLQMDDSADVSSIWRDYFNLKEQKNKDIFEIICEVCLMRPRDVLVFTGSMFESAVNNSHNKVEDKDYQYAVKYYSDFIHQNLIAEMNTKYQNIRTILQGILEKYVDVIEIDGLIAEIKGFGFDEKSALTLIDDLIQNGYFHPLNLETGKIYPDIRSALEAANQNYRKFLFLKLKPKYPKIVVKLSPQYCGVTRSHAQRVQLPFYKRIVKR